MAFPPARQSIPISSLESESTWKLKSQSVDCISARVGITKAPALTRGCRKIIPDTDRGDEASYPVAEPDLQLNSGADRSAVGTVKDIVHSLNVNLDEQDIQ